MPKPKGEREKEFDFDDGTGDNFDNPLAAGAGTPRDLAAGGDMSSTGMIAANDAEMTEEELADLIYAFQAADMDGGGAIDSEEFAMMLGVIGCDITMEQVKEIIGT
eukprot:SAG22_NODE_13818_length_394_cov_0.633898_1_plen_105_part_10